MLLTLGNKLKINEKYLQTYIINKQGKGLGITNFTIQLNKALKINYLQIDKNHSYEYLQHKSSPFPTSGELG